MAGAGRIVGGVFAAALVVAACGSGAHGRPVNPSGSAALHRLLEQGAAASARVGSGRLLLVETVVDPSHTGYLRETMVWRRAPRELRAVAVSDLSGQTLTSVILNVGPYAYFGGSAFAPRLPHGKSWLRERATALAGQVGLPLSSSQQIQDLRAASAVRRVGVSTVAGRWATEYRYVLDFGRLTARAKSSSLVGRLAPVLGKLQLPVRLWVDADGRPVLERASFGYHGATVHLSVTSSYGNAVHVTAPPPSVVATAPASGTGGSGTA